MVYKSFLGKNFVVCLSTTKSAKILPLKKYPLYSIKFCSYCYYAVTFLEVGSEVSLQYQVVQVANPTSELNEPNNHCMPGALDKEMQM